MAASYYPLTGYTIVNEIAYLLGPETLGGVTPSRITLRPSVTYGETTIDLYEVYTFAGLLMIIDQASFDLISGIRLVQTPTYTISSNEALPIGDSGISLVNTSSSSIAKVRELPNIILDGTETTMYALMDVFGNVITYTNLLGYRTITGLGYFDYTVTTTTHRDAPTACASTDEVITIYSSSDVVDNTLYFYTDITFETPYFSDGLVKLENQADSSTYALATNSDGSVRVLTSCVVPTPTPTVTPTPTPTPTVTP